MTQPPTWGAPPPQQPGGWPGQPLPGQPGPGGQWGPQQPWPAPVPPKKSGAAKWAIGAVSLVAVIAVTATVAVSCTKNSGDSNGGGGGGTKTSAAPSDVASANDTGPVGIITEDPSCAPWHPIQVMLAGVEDNGWGKRDSSLPSSAWTVEVRAQYEAVAKAMRKAADQAVPLSKMTTHRVMRELYGQFIAFGRAYADKILNVATYTPIDDKLAQAVSSAGSAIAYVCDAISSGSAAARAPMASVLAAPNSVAPIGDLANPQRIFGTPDVVCSDLTPTLNQLLSNTAFKNWANTDPKVPVSDWTPEQQSLNDAVAPVMTSTADALEKLAQRSTNPIVQDFIMLGVQYRRTYVQAMPTYQPSDSSIYLAGQISPLVVVAACGAVSG